MTSSAPVSQPTQENVLQWLQRVAEQPATLSVLMDLYRSSSELFYRLAVAGVPEDAPAWAKDLAELASRVRRFVRFGFDLDEQSKSIVGADGSLYLGESEFETAQAFLRVLGGIPGGKPESGRDYAGSQISEAEVRFAVGTAEEYHADKYRSDLRRKLTPRLLRLAEQDIDALRHGMPAYVIYELMFCASRVVQAPLVVFQGLLLRGRLSAGRAYCGKPRKAFDNDGRSVPAHPEMIYCVYTDPDGYVFDWDWVREDPLRRGYPENYRARFANPITEPAEAILLLPSDLTPEAFEEARAWHSQVGDCMFFYASDKPAYARRVNEDLTEYRAFGQSEELVGCKVKNFSELLAKVTDRRPAGSVPVSAVLAASLVRQMEGHQQREQGFFFKLIGEAALLMDDSQRKQFFSDLARMDASPEQYVNRICEMVLNLNPDHSGLQHAHQVLESQRAIKQSYLTLIAVAGNTSVQPRA